MLAKLGLHIVLADGHADQVAAIGIGLLHLAVVGLQLSVHVELYALHGDVGAGVGDTSLHREARHVLEVDVVGGQARRADEHRARAGRELVDAHHRSHLVVGATALEGDTFYNIVTLAVGHAVELQPLRTVGVGQHVGAHLGVVQLVEAVLAGYVEGVALHAQALVEGPVEHHALLRAALYAGVVLSNLCLAEGALPQAHVIDMALEAVALCARSRRTAYAQRGQGGGGAADGVPRGGCRRHRGFLQRLRAGVERPRAAAIDGCHVGEVDVVEHEVLELLLRLAALRAVDGIEVEAAARLLHA